MSDAGRILCLTALFVLGAAPSARAWDELGPLDEARRAHPAFFAKGAVCRTEIDGVEHWVFSGDSDLRDGFTGLSDAERWAEAVLDAKRNLVRGVSGGAANAEAEVSGVVVAYRFSDGTARRVVCLVPVENVRLVSSSRPAPAAAPAAPAAAATPAAPATPPEESAGVALSAPPVVPAEASDAGSAGTNASSPSPADPGLPRFSSPELSVPAIPGSGRE